MSEDHWSARLAGEARFAVRVEMPTTESEVPCVVLRLRATANPAEVHVRIPARRALALFVKLTRALRGVLDRLPPDAVEVEAADIVACVQGMADELEAYATAETAHDSVGAPPFARTLDDVEVRIALDLSSGAEITVAVLFWDGVEMLRVLSFAVVAVLQWILERAGTGETDSGEKAGC